MVDYVSFCNRTRQLSELFIKLGEEVEAIAAYTAELDIFWDGGANKAYIGRVGQNLFAIGEITVKIRDTIRILCRVLDIYMENETRIQRLIGEYTI